MLRAISVALFSRMHARALTCGVAKLFPASTNNAERERERQRDFPVEIARAVKMVERAQFAGQAVRFMENVVVVVGTAHLALNNHDLVLANKLLAAYGLCLALSRAETIWLDEAKIRLALRLRENVSFAYDLKTYDHNGLPCEIVTLGGLPICPAASASGYLIKAYLQRR